MVFAAASLTDALKQIGVNYEKSSGDQILFNFAASGVLVRQFEAGAPGDIFFSADEAQMNRMMAEGLLDPGSRRNLLGNSLVIVTPPDSVTVRSAEDLTNATVRRIALGEAKSVPAGTYSQAYLQKKGLWPLVQSKVIPCENVRAVLAAVESGNTDAGIVYKTDAAISRQVKVAYEIPRADGPKIVYPIALLKNSPQAVAARKFLEYLTTPSATSVFEKYGFLVPGQTAAKTRPGCLKLILGPSSDGWSANFLHRHGC